MIKRETYRFTDVVRVAFFIGGLALIICHPRTAGASWLIDPAGYHVSVHGQLSCLDCHSDMAGKDPHPDPEDVNKTLGDFFYVDQCTGCHDGVAEDIENGTHGGKRVKNPEAYGDCIRCHDPHYQRHREDQAATYNPAVPAAKQCGACHTLQSDLPEFSAGDKDCMACHRLPDPDDPRREEKISTFCFGCHGRSGRDADTESSILMPRMDVSTYPSSPHAQVSCLICHPQAAAFNHAGQARGDCRQCHLPHDEKIAHDAHLNITCQACHLQGMTPVKDPESGIILWQVDRKPGLTSTVHNMTLMEKEKSCRQCHFSANPLGAPAMVLPAKSLMCMPCHPATVSIGDMTTIISLILFLLGIGSLCSVWFSGSLAGDKAVGMGAKLAKLIWAVIRTVFSSKIFLILKTLIIDGLMQRRLYRQSRTRWFIHSLMVYPFIFRFIWGLIALGTSQWTPQWPLPWAMLDKNNPIGAFLFDLTGIMVIVGIGLAIVGGIRRRPENLPGLPKKDWLALGLFGSIIIVGFILEGVRIAMTGTPAGAKYAFMGYGISLLLTDTSKLTNGFGYIWYIHAILTGALVAYLPFSRMFHIITAPMVLAINAVHQNDSQGPRSL